jgi:mono/diheme cytochrome c family protein
MITTFLAVILVALPENQGQKQSSSYYTIPLEAVRQSNPVKPGAESIARGKKRYQFDCALCHGENGDGKGDTAKEMKLNVGDFKQRSTLRDRTDGELFYIIKNGKGRMPAEGARVKAEEIWDLVNYVRSLAQK